MHPCTMRVKHLSLYDLSGLSTACRLLHRGQRRTLQVRTWVDSSSVARISDNNRDDTLPFLRAPADFSFCLMLCPGAFQTSEFCLPSACPKANRCTYKLSGAILARPNNVCPNYPVFRSRIADDVGQTFFVRKNVRSGNFSCFANSQPGGHMLKWH